MLAEQNNTVHEAAVTMRELTVSGVEDKGAIQENPRLAEARKSGQQMH